ncbi:MAG: 3-dehydroquinate synthase [Dehalococcoidales bacterium]
MTYMQTVKVELGANSYEVRVGPGPLPKVGAWLKELGFSGKAVIIADTTVQGLYAEVLKNGLAGAGFEVIVLEIPPGEEQKTLKSAGRLYNRLNATHSERTTPILALGGGVTGDLAGFVAATYRRGVPYIQVPTTLLAMVDSSIGGKTAVDHGRLKNVIGAFYQPRLVVADIDTLKTLPAVELSNGMAEVIKMAAILSADLFTYLEANIGKAMSLDLNVLEHIVVENTRLKAGIVALDEKEAGPRVILNYGHTVGHAVEAVSGFALKHGQAVAIGMIAENEIARRMGFLDSADSSRLEKVIREVGLPVRIPELDKKKLMRAMQQDKKVRQGKVRFVLLKSIGKAFVADNIDPALIEEVLSGA